MIEKVTGAALGEVAHDLDVEGSKKRYVEQHDDTPDKTTDGQGDEEAFVRHNSNSSCVK